MTIMRRLARLEALQPPRCELAIAGLDARLAAFLARVGPGGIPEDDPRVVRLVALIAETAGTMQLEGER